MSGAIIISDHALVRWMERTGLLDLAPVKEQLAHSLERAAGAARSIDVAEYLILADGLIYVVKNQVLVTVLPEDGRHARAWALVARDQERG